MISSAQHQANRLNAQRSTGPVTAEGKAASSRNAIRHNLSGTTFVLLPNEDRAAFDRLAADYRREWSPRSEHESFLVAQMVQARWRLNRIARMEAEVYDAIFTTPFAEGQSDEGAIIIAYPRLSDGMLDKLHRYAKDAERSYHRAARELRLAQAQRPKPAAKPEAAIAATRSFETPVAKIRNEPIASAPGYVGNMIASDKMLSTDRDADEPRP